MMKGIITFDLDDTLVITRKAHAYAFKKAFEREGIEISAKKIEKFIDGRISKEIVRAVKPELKKQLIKRIINNHNKFLKEAKKFIKPIKNSSKILKKIKKDYLIGIVSNCSSEEEVITLLKEGKISPKIFDFIITIKNMKPKPSPQQLLKIKKISNSNKIIHVGDSVYDVLAAKRAGTISVGVLTGKAKKKQLKESGADFIIKDITFLPKLLKFF